MVTRVERRAAVVDTGIKVGWGGGNHGLDLYTENCGDQLQERSTHCAELKDKRKQVRRSV